MSFTFFPFLLPTPLGGGGGSGCVVLSCWLGLNHDTMVLGKKKMGFFPLSQNPGKVNREEPSKLIHNEEQV